MFSTKDPLCSDCRKVDWKDLVERPLDPNFTRIKPIHVFDDKHLYGRFVRLLKSQVELKSSSCRCCRILSTINHGSEDLNTENFSRFMNRDALRRLEATTLGSQMCLEPHHLDQARLALLRLSIQNKDLEQLYWQGTRYMAVLGPGKNSEPLKIPRFIMDNFAWIENAILHCKCSQNHAKSDRRGSQTVAGLILIDCIASTATSIITCSAPTSCQYATLSYVWGPQGCVPNGVIPAVVKDAMSVTLRLKLQYLWVDRYCIPQNDPDKKQQQIRNMNEVFSKSYITIMAAAGETAACGLAGVSTARIPQMETQVNGCTLLELPSIIDAVWGSTWVHRAWTLQEGLLSMRCLVFTDRGVLYRCKDTYIEEPLQQLVPNNAKVAMDNYESSCDRYILRLFATDEKTGEDTVIQLKQRIVQYTRRQLSFPQDSLNAFLGVFTNHEQNLTYRPPMSASRNRPSSSTLSSHIWGVPIEFDVDDGVPHLEWYHPTPPKKRRDKFPTWSWSGWEGDIKFTKEMLTPRFSSMIPEYNPISYDLPRDRWHETIRLYLTGPIVPLKFASQKDIDKLQKKMPANADVQISRQHSVFQLFPGTFSIIRSYMDTGIKTEDKTFGLLLFHAHGSDAGIGHGMSGQLNILESIIVLKEGIVQKRGIRSFSRVGLLYSEDVWNCKHINIKGASVDKEIFPPSGSLAFGQEIERQRICLE